VFESDSSTWSLLSKYLFYQSIRNNIFGQKATHVEHSEHFLDPPPACKALAEHGVRVPKVLGDLAEELMLVDSG
jgi:hypothetical protein